MVAIDGVFDLLECTLDAAYWKQLGIYEMDAGISPECWSTPNSSAVNMGPRYSSDGAVQYAINTVKAKKIVFVQSNVPGTGYIAAGPAALAKASNVPITELTENVPISDANSVALKLVDEAGSDGSVILNFTPPEALVILQAAQKLGARGPRQVMGLLDAVRHRLPGQVAGTEVEQEAVRQRRGGRRR